MEGATEELKEFELVEDVEYAKIVLVDVEVLELDTLVEIVPELTEVVITTFGETAPVDVVVSADERPGDGLEVRNEVYTALEELGFAGVDRTVVDTVMVDAFKEDIAAA